MIRSFQKKNYRKQTLKSIFCCANEYYPIFTPSCKDRKEKMLHFIITAATADKIKKRQFNQFEEITKNGKHQGC
jgi:hypothetical protein